jgi:ABC-2 type transport system permease protein
VLTVFLIFCGLTSYLIVETQRLASLDGMFSTITFLMFLVAPLLTMRLLSEEYRTGTIETLMTAPVSDAQVVIGKFLGALVFFVFMLLPTAAYVAVLQILGRPDLGLVGASYVGLLLMGAEFLAVGLFCSALTRNQILAGTLALVLLLVLWLLGAFAERVAGPLRPVLEYGGTMAHFRPFTDGRVAFQDVVYFLTVTAFWLFLAVRALESKRWR